MSFAAATASVVSAASVLASEVTSGLEKGFLPELVVSSSLSLPQAARESIMAAASERVISFFRIVHSSYGNTIYIDIAHMIAEKQRKYYP